MSSKVLYQREDHVVTITINRPEVMNAIDGETAAALVKAWQAFRDDDEAFVAIITGTGDRAFSAGADLKWVASLGGLRANVDRQRVSLYNSPGAVGYTRGVDIFKPTIAAVNGYCFAGGFETALWCDIRIAAEHAEFGRQPAVVCVETLTGHQFIADRDHFRLHVPLPGSWPPRYRGR